MALDRRSFVAGLGAASLAVSARSVRAQNFSARQYHPQPATSHLHIYLTKLWDAVRIETPLDHGFAHGREIDQQRYALFVQQFGPRHHVDIHLLR